MEPLGLGLELGMTSIAAAVARGPAVELVSACEDADELTSPAMVYAAHGRFCTGAAARQRAVGSPDRLATNILGNIASGQPVVIGDASYSGATLFGAMVHKVLTHITERAAETPQRLTLTHPTTWTTDQIAALAAAVRPAARGHGTLQMVPNLVAAAIGYAAAHPLEDGAAIAVVDVGATGFEAAVLERRGSQVLLLSPQIEHGSIGGHDFDRAILDYLDHVADGAVQAVDTTSLQGQITLARLRRDCRLAKEALSTAPAILVTAYLPSGPIRVRLSRSAFEAVIRPHIDIVIEAIVRMLRSISGRRLQAIVLTGGSAQIPLLQQLVTGIDTGAKVTVERHAAARGAAAVASPPADSQAGRDGGPSSELSAHPVPAPPLAGDRPPSSAVGSAAGPPRTGVDMSGLRVAQQHQHLAQAATPQPLPPRAPHGSAGPGSAQISPTTSRDRSGLTDAEPDPVTSARAAVGADDVRVAGPGPVPAAVVGEPSTTDHWPQADPTPQRPLWTRRRVLGAASIAAVAVVMVLLAVVFAPLRWTTTTPAAAPTASSAGAGTAVPPSQPSLPAAAADRPQPVVSVDRPRLSARIAVAPEPGFAAVSPSGRWVYIANRGDGRTAGSALTVIDTRSEAATATIAIPDGLARYLAFSPDGARLYVSIDAAAGSASDRVDVVDTISNAVTASIDVGARPSALAAAPDGSEIWVPNHDSGTVSVIDAHTNAVVATVRVPPNPHWVAFSPDGSRAYTANHESNLVAVLDARTRAIIGKIPVGASPHSVAAHPDKALIANVNYDGSSVSLIDVNTDAVLGAPPACRKNCVTVRVGSHPQDLAWSPDGKHLYVTNVGDATVSVINVATRKVTATIPVGAGPTSIAVLPSGEKAYVTSRDAGSVSILKLNQ